MSDIANIANIDKQEIKKFLLDWQQKLCDKFSSLDGEQFKTDTWQHQSGGAGITRVLRNGNIFESAGVNFSHVMGDSLPKAATQNRPQLEGAKFEAMGVSLVIHPKNPHVPTSHANLRFFMATTKTNEVIWWFGGGFDLTPYYAYVDDCIHWHQEAREACRPFGVDIYNRFKMWADDYFFIKHRNEHRGIGGLFFDDLNEWGVEDTFDFVKLVAEKYISAYFPIVEKRKEFPYTDAEREFQLYRRGRYVEFNLVYDRGTIFGLQTGGRTESILMSLPSVVNWKYNWQPKEGTREFELTDFYLKPQEWLHLDQEQYSIYNNSSSKEPTV